MYPQMCEECLWPCWRAPLEMEPFRERLEFHKQEALSAKTMPSCPEWRPHVPIRCLFLVCHALKASTVPSVQRAPSPHDGAFSEQGSAPRKTLCFCGVAPPTGLCVGLSVRACRQVSRRLDASRAELCGGLGRNQSGCGRGRVGCATFCSVKYTSAGSRELLGAEAEPTWPEQWPARAVTTIARTRDRVHNSFPVNTPLPSCRPIWRICAVRHAP